MSRALDGEKTMASRSTAHRWHRLDSADERVFPNVKLRAPLGARVVRERGSAAAMGQEEFHHRAHSAAVRPQPKIDAPHGSSDDDFETSGGASWSVSCSGIRAAYTGFCRALTALSFVARCGR